MTGTVPSYTEEIQALREYVEERPWGYRQTFTEDLMARLEAGQPPEEALAALEEEAHALAGRHVRTRRWGLNSSLENTLEELRGVLLP